jgi:transcriptional regulator with XRE-family HTH domain
VSSGRPDIGAQIQKARLALNLSQVELARRAGYAERSVQAWEGGERTPRLDNLMTLARVLAQDVAFFYGSDDVPAAAPTRQAV